MSPQVSNSAPANPSACAVSPARRWLVAGSWTAFVVALLFYAGSVLRVDPMRTELTNLDPRPDAVEYFALARSLLSTGAAEIRIGDEILPSRYPVGFPVLMLPWLAALPEAQALAAPVRTNQTLGLLLLVEREVAASDAGLIGEQEQPIASGASGVQCVRSAGSELDVLGPVQIRHMADDRAVAVEKKGLGHRRGRFSGGRDRSARGRDLPAHRCR